MKMILKGTAAVTPTFLTTKSNTVEMAIDTVKRIYQPQEQQGSKSYSLGGREREREREKSSHKKMGRRRGIMITNQEAT